MIPTLKIFKFLLLFSLLSLLFTACGGGGKIIEYPRIYHTAVNSMNQGNDRYKRGCYKESLEFMFKAHEFFSLSGYQNGVAKSLNNIGNIYRGEGNTESALLFFEESIRIYENLNDVRGVIQTLSNKSAVYIDMELYDKADSVLSEAEKLAVEEGFTYVSLLTNRGIILTRQKRYDLAEKLLSKALAESVKENEFEYSALYFAMGMLLTDMGEFQEAEEKLLTALESDRDSGFSKGIADDLGALGRLSLKRGMTDAAVDYYLRSLKIYSLLNDAKNSRKTMGLLKKIIDEHPEKADRTTIGRFFYDLWKDGKRLTDSCE